MYLLNIEEFLNVLGSYNLKIWPLQIIAFLFGLVAVVFAFRKTKSSGKVILAILSLLWLWNGAVFCLLFWSTIYKLAYIFAALLVIQGALLIVALFRSDIVISFHPDWMSVIGIILIIYSMAGYQIFGYFLGHIYPNFFPFGLVPCPTTIFTIGLLMMTYEKIPGYYLIIPIIVSTGGFMVVPMGILEDIGLILAGIFGIVLILRKDKQSIGYRGAL